MTPVQAPAAQEADCCDHICRECGKHETGRWMKSCMDRLKEQQLCFTCEFWTQKVRMQDAADPNAVRIDGVHYYIGEPNVKGWFAGYGGAGFGIKFNDGRTVATNNLWCQGRIPDNFTARLPDNAEFIRDARATGSEQ